LNILDFFYINWNKNACLNVFKTGKQEKKNDVEIFLDCINHI